MRNSRSTKMLTTLAERERVVFGGGKNHAADSLGRGGKAVVGA